MWELYSEKQRNLKLENPGKNLKKIVIERLQMESGGTKIFVYSRPQNSWL